MNQHLPESSSPLPHPVPERRRGRWNFYGVLRRIGRPTFGQRTKDVARWIPVLGLLILAVAHESDVRAQVAGPIDLWPQNNNVEVGQSKQFGAYVPISPNTVTWSVNEVVGGNSVLGTINANGLYQAPSVAPASSALTIKVQSTAFPASFKTTTLTVIRPYPWVWSVSPSALQVGAYSVSFNGSNFAPDSVALANGLDLTTTYVSPTRITAVGNASAPGTIQFAVRQPAPGPITGNSVSANVTGATIGITVSPTAVSVVLGSAQTFGAAVTGSANTAVTWSVVGGSANGTVGPSGVYTAPGVMPSGATVTVRAHSVANPAVFANANVTLVPPPVVTVVVSPAAASVLLGGTQTFGASVTGSANSAVTWSVVGGSANGTVSSTGVYTAPGVMPSASPVTLRAHSVASPAAYAEAVISLTAVVNNASLLAAARFLEQSSFGPTPGTIAQVQQLGIEEFLAQQFALPATVIPTPGDNSAGALQRWSLHNYTTAPDQLRQRVIYALSQIVVVSVSKQVYADAMLPWMRALNTHAFGNYRDLLREVTKSSSMGKFLDLANSVKAGAGGGANENYARELMQLFTIGLWDLQMDGSLVMDTNGFPVPSYTQETVAEVARALTGWTYATAPGMTPSSQNNEFHGAAMETRPQNHDTGSKTFLGATLPAGRTVEQDLESVLDVLINHPNTAPFVATRLIRSLVVSNPSAGYIQRVAQVFSDTGGNLQAVVTALLLDAEARDDVAVAPGGRLREPILHICTFLRALNGQFSSTHQLTYLFSYMAQSPLNPPSVFSWFSPFYRVPNSPLFGPEFQIYSPTEATLRGNFLHYVLSGQDSGVTVDLAPFQPYGSDLPALVELVNQRLLHGRMPAGMKQVLINAAAPGYDAKTRIETVLYLTALSGQFAVQH